MNYQKNLKYFQSNDKHFYVGVILLAVGAVLLAFSLFFRFSFLPSQSMIAVFVAIVGAIVAFVPRSLRSNENDIEEAVAQNTRGYAEEVEENTPLAGNISRRLKPLVVGDYVFEGENIICRRGKDDRKYRSTVYKASALIFTDVGIYISQKTFSLIEDSVSESATQFIYEDLDGVSISEEELTLADGGKTKIGFLVFSENGKEAIRVPMKRGAEADKLCDDINYQIAETKKVK